MWGPCELKLVKQKFFEFSSKDKEVEKKNGNVIPCYGDKAWEKSDKDNWGKCEAIKGFEVINASPPPPTQTQDG